MRMTLEALADPARSKGVIKRIADGLGSTRRLCVRGSVRPRWTGAPGPAPPRVTPRGSRNWRREVRELGRANAILKSASAYFAAEPGRPSR